MAMAITGNPCTCGTLEGAAHTTISESRTTFRSFLNYDQSRLNRLCSLLLVQELPICLV